MIIPPLTGRFHYFLDIIRIVWYHQIRTDRPSEGNMEFTNIGREYMKTRLSVRCKGGKKLYDKF